LSSAGRALTSTLTPRIGDQRTVAAGFVVIAAGMLAVARLGADPGLADLMPGFLLVGIGSGLTTPLTATILGVLPRERTGVE
jgi:dipeptide/tripeptide permease